MAVKKGSSPRKWTDEQRAAVVRTVLDKLLASPDATLPQVAREVKVADAQLRRWLNQYGLGMGWTGSVSAFRNGRGQTAGGDGRQKPRTVTEVDDAWLAENGKQLRLSMGVPEPEPEPSETLLSRPEPPPSEMDAVIVREPSERTFLRRHRPEPLYRAAPVQADEPPPPPPPPSAPLIEGELLKQALREKDAVLTTLEILLREGRIKIPH